MGKPSTPSHSSPGHRTTTDSCSAWTPREPPRWPRATSCSATPRVERSGRSSRTRWPRDCGRSRTGSPEAPRGRPTVGGSRSSPNGPARRPASRSTSSTRRREACRCGRRTARACSAQRGRPTAAGSRTPSGAPAGGPGTAPSACSTPRRVRAVAPSPSWTAGRPCTVACCGRPTAARSWSRAGAPRPPCFASAPTGRRPGTPSPSRRSRTRRGSSEGTPCSRAGGTGCHASSSPWTWRRQGRHLSLGRTPWSKPSERRVWEAATSWSTRPSRGGSRPGSTRARSPGPRVPSSRVGR